MNVLNGDWANRIFKVGSERFLELIRFLKIRDVGNGCVIRGLGFEGQVWG